MNRNTATILPNTRRYDKLLGRFAYADSILQVSRNPKAWDRYAFVYYNPIRYNDPTRKLASLDGHLNDPGYKKTIPIAYGSVKQFFTNLHI